MKLIDVHVYYGKWGFPIELVSIEQLLELMKKVGIEKAIIMSALSLSYDMSEGNSELCKAIEPYDSLLGYVYLNGNYVEDSIKEMERYLDSPKFVGAKYHPELSVLPPNSPQCEPLWNLLESRYKKPVLIHTWTLPEHNNVLPSSLPEFVIDVAKRHPNLKIIMGHMGGPGWRRCVQVIQDVNNIWIDFCSSYADKDKIGHAVECLGADRVLFGTGMTENNPWMQLGALLEADISDEDKKKIMYWNAKRIFQL